MSSTVQEKTYSSADQEAFACFSGDFNPVHLDPLVARRTLFGQPVVHGVHALLWGLDSWMATQAAPTALRTLKARFNLPVFPKFPQQCRWIPAGSHEIRITLNRENRKTTSVLASYGSPFESVIEIPKKIWTPLIHRRS